MCGIAGHFGRPRGRRRARAHDAPRSRSAARMRSTTRRSRVDGTRLADGARRAVGLVHARLSIIDPRPLADQPMATRRRQRCGSATTARCTAGRRPRASLPRAGSRFRTRSRHRVHPARLRGVGHRRRCCRVCAACSRSRSSISARGGARRARPAGTQTHRLRARRDGLRVRLHGAQRAAVAPARAIAGSRPMRSMPISRIATFPRRARCSRISRACPMRIAWSTTCRREPSRCVATGRRSRARRRLRAHCSTRRSNCGWWPTARSDSSCRAASIRAPSRAGSPPPGTPDCARSRRRFPVRRSTRARRRARPQRRLASPTSASWCRRRSATTSTEIVATLDEPFADPSSFPTWYLARETERHVKVVLGGDGGDELFAGYKRVAKHLRNGWRGSLRMPLPVLPDARPKGWRKVVGELSARLGERVRAALLRPHAQPATLPATRRARAAGTLLANPRLRRHVAARPAAAVGFRQLPARIRAAQGRPVHDGAWPRIARAAARSSLRRGGAGAACRAALHRSAQAVSRDARPGSRASRHLRTQEAGLQSPAGRLAQRRTFAAAVRGGHVAFRADRGAASSRCA